MSEPVINISIETILGYFTQALDVLKKVFAWLGILILPEDGEYDYPEDSKDQL